MARGMSAFVFVAGLILAMTMVSSVGYAADLGVGYDVAGQNEDVQRAADALEGISYDEDRSSSILQGPLAAVIPFVEHLQLFTTIIGNISGMIQLLYGATPVVADSIELMFDSAILVTILFGIRGAVQ